VAYLFDSHGSICMIDKSGQLYQPNHISSITIDVTVTIEVNAGNAAAIASPIDERASHYVLRPTDLFLKGGVQVYVWDSPRSGWIPSVSFKEYLGTSLTAEGGTELSFAFDEFQKKDSPLVSKLLTPVCMVGFTTKKGLDKKFGDIYWRVFKVENLTEVSARQLYF